MIVIGDVAGQFHALMRLVEQFPSKEDLIFVGDLMDRGPHSKDVISWVKANAKESLLGNHEHMMLDYYNQTKQYEDDIWDFNGGVATQRSYANLDYPEELDDHLAWLAKRPLVYETDTIYVSHAPVPKRTDRKLSSEGSFIWNRYTPVATPKLQIFGHNGHLKKYKDKEGRMYALCIDDSREGNLCAYNTETTEIYKESFR